jgi:hypothetical protein
LQPQIAEFLTQSLPGDPQQAGGLVLVPTGVLKDARQQEAIQLAMRVRVKLLSIRPEPLADECFQVN